jgi:hypothetical protein
MKSLSSGSTDSSTAISCGKPVGSSSHLRTSTEPSTESSRQELGGPAPGAVLDLLEDASRDHTADAAAVDGQDAVAAARRHQLHISCHALRSASAAS